MEYPEGSYTLEPVGPDPTKTAVGDDPNHRMVMAWADKDHEFTYVHKSFGMTHADHTLWMADRESGKVLSRLFMNNKGDIQGIETHPKYRRQGLATKLYNFAKRLHDEVPGIPAPQHSTSRTHLGQQWAKSTGEDIPPWSHVVRDKDYNGAYWN